MARHRAGASAHYARGSGADVDLWVTPVLWSKGGMNATGRQCVNATPNDQLPGRPREGWARVPPSRDIAGILLGWPGAASFECGSSLIWRVE